MIDEELSPSPHLLEKRAERRNSRIPSSNQNDDHNQDLLMEDNHNNDDENNHNDRDDPKPRYRRLAVYGEHKRAVSSVKFAPSRYTKPDGALCATASASAFIKVWDLVNPHEMALASTCLTKNKQKKQSPRNQQKLVRQALPYRSLCVGHSRGINDLSWNPVSPLLASASDDKTVRLWDVITGDSLVEFKGHDNFVFCVDQHHALLVSGSFDETVKLWDIRSGDCVSTLPAHSDPVTAVSFNRDGTCVASASHDGLIRIWDTATGECLKTIFATGNPPVSGVTYSPNGKYLLAGTLDSTLRLWPVARTGSHKCAKAYQCPEVHVNTKYSVVSDFTYDGNIVTGSETGAPVIYDLQSRKVIQTLKGHEDVVLAVSAHDKLPLICSGGMTADRKVNFWVQCAGGSATTEEEEEEEEEEGVEQEDGGVAGAENINAIMDTTSDNAAPPPSPPLHAGVPPNAEAASLLTEQEPSSSVPAAIKPPKAKKPKRA